MSVFVNEVHASEVCLYVDNFTAVCSKLVQVCSFYVFLELEDRCEIRHVKKTKLHGLESASELYRPSDRRLSAT
jgi:hypothetical protein